MTDFTLSIESRADEGRRASRRIRRTGYFPAVVYGGKKPATSISLEHRTASRMLKDDAVFSHVIQLKAADGTAENVIIRGIQRHPYKDQILHMDFQRISAGQKVTVHVPIHFTGEAECVGVRMGGGQLHHVMVDIELSAPVDKLPEFIAVDVSGLDKGHSLHLSDIKLPADVSIPALAHGDNKTVVSVSAPRGAAEETAAEGGASA